MYKRFYGLQRNPFEITPDPSFLFTTKKHNEALAALYYGVRRHKGFVVMTGEVGTGKTLLVRCLLQLLNQSKVAYAYVFNPRLSPVEFLQYVVGDFGLPVSGKTKSELLLQLGTFVISRHQKGLTTVLVVDEAHHVSAEVLEEIRLLTNLETTKEKLLQILLVGQPELDDVLDSVHLRQLKQRIALRPRLEPLDLTETQAYVYRRLQKAGSTDPATIFPMEAILEIHAHSRGIPRLINTICETALIQGYANQTRAVTPAMIEEIAIDFRLNVMHVASSRENSLQDESSEVRQAARTLLDLYSQLRRAEPVSDDIDMPIVTRTRKNEPYI
jgi:general secretion pathway protein A